MARKHALKRKSRPKPRTRARAADQTAPPALVEAVINVVRRMSPFRPPDLTPCLDLRQALGITDEMKQALSNPFQDLARQHNPKATISDDEAGRLESVEDSLVLVATKALFTFKREC